MLPVIDGLLVWVGDRVGDGVTDREAACDAV